MTSVDEVQTILDWNRDEPRVPYLPPLADETVAHAFEQQAKRNPLHCAVVTETNAEISYQAANDKADKIARCLLQAARLRTEGIVVGSAAELSSFAVGASATGGSPSPSCVLVALPRSTSLPIALLGVVKTRMVYWAVDLTLQSPGVILRTRERLAANRVISDEGTLRLLFPSGVPMGCTCVVLSALGDVVSVVEGQAPAGPEVEAEHRIVCPAGAMYLEFTSGSTGEPKAVAVPHSACVSLCRNSSMYAWDDQTRSVLYHTVAFDVHVYDLWGPWMHGGSVIALEGSVTNVQMVLDRCRAARATHLSMTPFGFVYLTKLHFASSSAEQQLLNPLCIVMLCGEALEFPLLERWYSAPHRPRFYNSYGITETTVVNTFLEVTPERLGWPSSIGRRLPHTLMLLLSDTLEVVPHGERGELYLAGDCLAHGYITSVEKNDTSFLPIPPHLVGPLQVTAPSMSLRVMYKTGDVAKFDDDHGGFVYCGRADAEIKSAGFRVHPLEVEEEMNRMNCVKTAVVVAATHPDGRKALFAFVHRRSGDVNKATVLTELRRRVADYKVPTLLFLEDSDVLPLSATNKIERKLLTSWATDFLSRPQDAPRPPLPSSAAQKKS